jgi:HTH-type transcriptional regulator / antitoxin HipB
MCLFPKAYRGGYVEEVARTSKQLGSLLRQRRRELGLSQAALASRIGLRQSTISALETSAKDTRTATLLSVLATLDLELVIRSRTKSSEKDIEALF